MLTSAECLRGLKVLSVYYNSRVISRNFLCTEKTGSNRSLFLRVLVLFLFPFLPFVYA